MRRWGTGLVGSIVEAWAELRIHRTRVLLSLFGVAVAITALTATVGLGGVLQQATTESFERGSGRPATLYISALDSTTGEQADPATMTAAFESAGDRYGIEWATRNGYASILVDLPDGAVRVESNLVDADFGTIHRTEIVQGDWFTDSDERRLAPAVVINTALWEMMGSPDLRTHPTFAFSDIATVGVVIGVTPDYNGPGFPAMSILFDGYAAVASPEQLSQVYPNYEMWVPEEISEELITRLQRDIGGALGEGVQVDVNRQDYVFAAGGEDPLLGLKLAVLGVAALVLFLGALSLVNISLVTVRQRIREIGIRRSFGATAGRVFFAVMMESVVGTIAAGVVGVFLAVLIVENPWLQEQIAPGVTDLPGFPVEAALIGLGAATAVGALAGLLPAVVAVRVKVIDAIRF